MLSQIEKVDPGYFRDWIIVMMCVIGAVYLVVSLVEKIRAKKAASIIVAPDPLRVTQVADLATRKEVEAMGARLEADIDDVRRSIDQKENTAREENGKLHHRIDEVVEKLSETKGLLTGVKENTDKLLAKLLK
jgi:predicted sugar kinase